VRSQQQVLPKRKIILHAPAALVGELAGAGSLPYVESLAGLEPVAGQPAAPPPGASSVAVRFEAYDLALSNLAEAVDAAAESDRRGRRAAELTKSIAAMLKRLENPGYIAKAPPKLVEESRAQLAEAQAELKRLQNE
jgi:valyl-tRNA synthetase